MENRLLTPAVLDALRPFPLYSQESRHIPQLRAVCAFAIGGVRWYVCEGNAEGDTFTLYGLVCGMGDAPELGYINADELAGIELDGTRYGFPAGVTFRVEPLDGFKPCRLKDITETDVQEYCRRMAED